jgi:hypothetical protein
MRSFLAPTSEAVFVICRVQGCVVPRKEPFQITSKKEFRPRHTPSCTATSAHQGAGPEMARVPSPSVYQYVDNILNGGIGYGHHNSRTT